MRIDPITTYRKEFHVPNMIQNSSHSRHLADLTHLLRCLQPNDFSKRGRRGLHDDSATKICVHVPRIFLRVGFVNANPKRYADCTTLTELSLTVNSWCWILVEDVFAAQKFIVDVFRFQFPLSGLLYLIIFLRLRSERAKTKQAIVENDYTVLHFSQNSTSAFFRKLLFCNGFELHKALLK